MEKYEECVICGESHKNPKHNETRYKYCWKKDSLNVK